MSGLWRPAGLGLAALLPLAVLLAAVTWQPPTSLPQVGFDHSWQIALQLAAAHGPRFGDGVDFTYGPLGFLANPIVIDGWYGAAALLFALVAQVALAAAVLRAAARTWGVAAGVAAAFLALGLTLFVSDVLVFVAFFGAVWALERDEPPAARWLVPAAGALAALELLVKLNGGVVCLVLFALAAWRVAPRGWRAEALLAASFAVTALVLWLVTGNSLAQLPTWIRESAHIVTSYSGAVAYDPTGAGLDVLLAALLVAGLAALVFVHVRPLSRGRAVALGLVTAAVVYAYLKEGFVRHDVHVLQFFAALAVAALAFRWRAVERWAAALLVVGTAVASLVTPSAPTRSVYRPIADARHAVTQLANVVDRRHGRRAEADARAFARAQLDVPRRDLALLGDHTVDSIPYETSAIWAYGLRWRPEPLLQWYTVFDSQLDAFNAKALAAHGAERVLRQRVSPAADGKLPEFEAPATYVALACHYRELASDGSWEVLARVADRCGPPRALVTIDAHAGVAVAVPPAPNPGDVVYATIRFRTPLWSRAEWTLLKPLTLPRIDIAGNRFRFLPATAGGPLVMHMPPTGGMSPLYGGDASYGRFALVDVPGSFSVTFYAMPMHGAPYAAPTSPAGAGSIAGTRLVVRGHSYRIDPSAFEGTVDGARASGAAGVLAGWAVARATKQPAPLVAAFAAGKLVAVARPSQSRPDVGSALGAVAAGHSGFDLAFALAAGAHVRVFALGGGRASELGYIAGYPWQ